MNYFIPFYGEFHSDPIFHKQISNISYNVLAVLEPDVLDDFINFASGLSKEKKFTQAMKIVYNILEKEIKVFYQNKFQIENISIDSFISRVILYDGFSK